MQWSFFYEGPIAPVDDRKCYYCTQAAVKERAFCPNHCGLETALAKHVDVTLDADGQSIMTAEHSPSWGAATAFVEAAVASVPGVASVRVHLVHHRDLPDSPLGEFESSIILRK
jgi:ribosomal protein S27AE